MQISRKELLMDELSCLKEQIVNREIALENNTIPLGFTKKDILKEIERKKKRINYIQVQYMLIENDELPKAKAFGFLLH